MPDSTRYTSSQIYVTPEEDLRLVWSSSNASSCTTNFGGSGTSGSVEDAVTLNPGGSRVYKVECQNSAGDSVINTITARVPDILVDTFEIDPYLVRPGDTAMVNWKLELDNSLTSTPAGDMIPYDYQCEINGAVKSSPYTFNASDNAGEGSVETRELNAKYVSTLQCNSFVSGEAAVEVTPTSEEI